jgi:hypothetical protein
MNSFSVFGTRFGCNLCKKDIPTFAFMRIDKKEALWFCDECLSKLREKDVKE